MGVSRNVLDSIVVVAHAYRKKTHKIVNKAYRFLKFMIPPDKPVYYEPERFRDKASLFNI